MKLLAFVLLLACISCRDSNGQTDPLVAQCGSSTFKLVTDKYGKHDDINSAQAKLTCYARQAAALSAQVAQLTKANADLHTRQSSIDAQIGDLKHSVDQSKAEQERLASANASLSADVSRLQTEAAKPNETVIHGHLFERKSFQVAACTAKATEILLAEKAKYQSHDESSMTFLVDSNYVIVECNGWQSFVSVSGRDSKAAADLAQRLDFLIFPKN